MWRRLARDESGIIIPYVSLLLVAFIGLALLAVDGSRLFGMSTSLQKGVDAIAIAMAAELDGRPDAIERAERAGQELVDNAQVFGDAPAEIAFTARFLHSIPNDDALEIGTGFEALGPADARFVEVTATPVTLNTVLPASFIGDFANTATAGAQAVAGFTSAVCNFTPMFICNPFEGDPDIDLISEPPESDVWRRLIEMKAQGGGSAAYFPGNFGWLEAPGGPGKNELGESIARASVDACFQRDSVTTEPGQMASLHHDVNVRFDMFPQGQQGQSRRADANYRPALNVRKGYKPHQSGDWCRAQPPDSDDDPGMGLPRDICFYDGVPGTCDDGLAGGRVGDGDWDIEDYWLTNYGETPPNGWTNDDPPSRYEVYRWELDNPSYLDTAAGEFDEIGGPMCATTATPEGPDRRIIYGAIINCIEHGPMSGRVEDVPVLAFGRFFLTEPANQPPNTSVWAELAGLVNPGTDEGLLHDIVQLYR
jgi:hypothetical protein